MKLFNKMAGCALAGLLTTGVAVADDYRNPAGPGMSQGDRYEMMRKMGDEKRQAMRKMMDERRRVIEQMSDEERQAMRKKMTAT